MIDLVKAHLEKIEDAKSKRLLQLEGQLEQYRLDKIKAEEARAAQQKLIDESNATW
jgi:hypothetical protein